jgi:hypothetical protein
MITGFTVAGKIRMPKQPAPVSLTGYSLGQRSTPEHSDRQADESYTQLHDVELAHEIGHAQPRQHIPPDEKRDDEERDDLIGGYGSE